MFARWLGWGLAGLALACDAAPRSGSIAAQAAEHPGARQVVASPAAASLVRLPGAYAEGRRGAVSSAEAHASDVGLAVLSRGGNAVDAAVAVGFALGVTHPSAGNIGGGGFMIVRLPDGGSTAIDYREVAPSGASADMFLDGSGDVVAHHELGPRAAGIPGVVAGLGYAHRRFGSLPWPELVAPAIALARDGVPLDAVHAEELRDAAAAIRSYRGDVPVSERGLWQALTVTLGAFEKREGEPYAEGDLWRQPALAGTLQAIAEGGPDAFYGGSLARDMASRVRAMGGIWRAQDLANYRVIEREPIRFEYRGHGLITMPPPSSGGVALRQILAASEALRLYELDWDSPERIHLYVEILRRTFADRNNLVGDPDFVEVPLARLLDPAYVKARMADITPRAATPSARVGAGVPRSEPEHTTHFSVMDGAGMAVANTYTLNGDFGALVAIEGTGVILNDEMDDFTAKVGAPNQFGLIQGAQNAIAPGKRMLSSMSPTIVTSGDRVRAVLGSPGGPTIITTVAQLVLQLIDTGRSLERAVAAPRIHHQWLPDEIQLELELPLATRRALEQLGHRFGATEAIGHANCIELDPATGTLRAVADVVRLGGKAAAY